MNYWIIAQSDEVFRLEDLLKEQDVVDWKQFNNFEVGDIVYIYNSKPYRRIRYKMEVIRTNVPSSEYINDEKYWGDKHNMDEGLKHNRYVRLHLLTKEPENGGPTFDYLRSNGLKSNLQSAVRILDSALLRKIRNKMSPSTTERIARICWNTNGWERPSGPEGKLNSGFEGDMGFGHEEWLFDRRRICDDGYHYGFIQCLNGKSFEGKITLHLYSKSPAQKTVYLGYIRDAEYVNPDDAEEIVAEYESKGWNKEMMQEITSVGGHPNKETVPFNLRFQFENFVDYSDKQLYIAKDDPNFRAGYYGIMLKKLEPFRFENGVVFGNFRDNSSDEISDLNNEIAEGAKLRITVNRYERSNEARRKCIEANGCRCAVCGFDFKKVYGKIGEGFIHVHHIKPIAEIGESYVVNPATDLVPVCPNCHAMLHHGEDGNVLTVEELKKIMKINENHLSLRNILSRL